MINRSSHGSVLVAQDLTVRYGQRVAVRDVSFSVAPCELVAIVGPNGAGKSSLFKAICGVVSHEGSVELCGTHCHHRRDHLSAAYIPQRADLDLDFPISVGELVSAGRRRFRSTIGRATAGDRDIVCQSLERVGLDGLAARPVGSLSGGQIQRAFLARALAQQAQLVLLDEALSGVDQPRTESLLDLFAELCAEGTTMLVATHDLALARRRFARCLAINGRLVADGSPSRVLDEATIDATYGSAVMASAT